jgi:hypothetical protein
VFKANQTGNEGNNVKHLNREQLKLLHSDFTKYRDKECNGCADKSVDQFYKENAARYENVKLNQCDGCGRDLPIVDGIHREANGMPYMTCKADLYM